MYDSIETENHYECTTAVVKCRNVYYNCFHTLVQPKKIKRS